MANGNRNAPLLVLVVVLLLVAVATGMYAGRLHWRSAMLESDLERAQQKLAALAAAPPPPPAAAAPTARTLEPDERKAIVDRLKEETGELKDVWFQWAPNDREAATYARALQAAFEEAGWKVRKTEPARFTLRPGVFFLMADASPPAYVSTALGALQAAAITMSSGRDYRAFNERKTKEDPSWRGFEMDADQAYLIAIGPMPTLEAQ